MLEIQHAGHNLADIYKGMRLVARFSYQPTGRVMVKVFHDGHDEIVESVQAAMNLVRERI